MKLSKENKQRIGFLLLTILFCAILSLFDTSYHLKGRTTPQTTENPTQSIATTLNSTINDTTTTEEETTTEPAEPSEPNSKHLGWFWCTSYCSCPICCKQYAYNRPTDENGNEIVVGASGMVLEPGRSVAVDPSIIPYGTVLIIDGQEYVAADTGIKGYRLDFYYSSHEEALSHANKWCDVYLK